MRVPVRLLFIPCVCGVVALAVRAQVTSPQPATKPATVSSAPADNARLRALLTEKRDTLRQIEDVRRAERQQGAGTAEDLLRASLAVVDADLDLARTARERIAFCEKRVQLRKQLEDIAEAQRKSAGLSFEELQRVRIDRMDAEIALEREHAAANAVR
jgi:hypothetical protein